MESPQKAAERIWEETKHDPVETMRLFDEWARQEPERMLGILDKFWPRVIRRFLERRGSKIKGETKIGAAFYTALMAHETGTWNQKRWKSIKAKRKQLNQDEAVKSTTANAERFRLAAKRRAAGIKVVQAEVNVQTGMLIKLIDKEIGPFAHIRINGLRLAEVNVGQALWYCDHKTADVAFVRALCSLIPHPQRPIGEQWTVEIVKEAKRLAGELPKANRLTV